MLLQFLGNFIWFIFGGFISGLLWWLVALIMIITVIGIPFSRACFEIGLLAFFPFGKEIVKKSDIGNTTLIGNSFGFLANIVWFIFGGLWIFLTELFAGVLLCITVIGIPFGIQHFKLGFLALAPVGKRVVTKRRF